MLIFSVSFQLPGTYMPVHVHKWRNSSFTVSECTLLDLCVLHLQRHLNNCHMLRGYETCMQLG